MNVNNLRRSLPHLAELILAASGSFAVVPAPLMGKGEVGSKYVSRNLAALLHKQLY